MEKYLKWLSSGLMVLLAASLISTASAQSFTVSGKVVNSSNAPVSQAKVSLNVTGIETFTDANGLFSLVYDNTGVEDLAQNRYKSHFDGKRLYLECPGGQVRVRIIDLAGREVAAVLPMQNLSGEYMLYPEAYVSSDQPAVMIIQALVGGELRSFKFIPAARSSEEKGLTEISSRSHAATPSPLKSVSATDTLVITHADYQTKVIPINCSVCKFGDITLSGILPAAPSLLSGSPQSASSIGLTWQDNADNETGFRIERSTRSLFEWTDFSELALLAPNTTSYTDDGLVQSTSYKYRVCAFNDEGNSPFSDEVVVTTEVSNPITISGPNSSTGTFDITVSYSWPGFLGSTSDRFILEESTSPTGGFTAIENSPWGSRPQSYTFTLTRSTGTYYYRARAYNTSYFTDYTDVISVSVNTPVQKASLKLVNNSHYYMIDILLNNQQQVPTGYAVLAGDSYTFEFETGGLVNYRLGVGFWDGSSRNVWFILTGTVNITVGTTTTVTFDNPTIQQMLTGFSGSRNWTGEYWVDLIMHMAAFQFRSDASWTFYDDGSATGSGSVTLVEWLDYSSYIKFKICPSCDVITMYYPFAQFYYQNGPPGWETILYTAQ